MVYQSQKYSSQDRAFEIDTPFPFKREKFDKTQYVLHNINKDEIQKRCGKRELVPQLFLVIEETVALTGCGLFSCR